MNKLNSEGERVSKVDWHVDLQTDYVSYFPAGLGFIVSIQFRDFSTDTLSPDDFRAELMHWPASGELPSNAELARLRHLAAYLFGTRFTARLERQKARDLQHPPSDEDASHDLETNIHAA